jgi:hypothetical protein
MEVLFDAKVMLNLWVKVKAAGPTTSAPCVRWATATCNRRRPVTLCGAGCAPRCAIRGKPAPTSRYISTADGPTHPQPAYVLHSRAYKETSALVDFSRPGPVRAVLRRARGKAAWCGRSCRWKWNCAGVVS